MSERADRRQLSFGEWVRLPQTLVALSALLLSSCGLFIAVYEASLVRRAQRASVWPQIEVRGSASDRRIRIAVRNNGIGPARIEKVAVLIGGETRRNWSDLLRAVGADPETVSPYQSLINGAVLAAGSGDNAEEKIFEVTPTSGAGAPEAMRALGRAILQGSLDVSVCYCSVFDECWISNLQDALHRSRGLEAPGGSRQVADCDSAKRSEV